MDRRSFIKCVAAACAAPIAVKAIQVQKVIDPVATFADSLKWEVLVKNLGSSGTIDPLRMRGNVYIRAKYKGEWFGTEISYPHMLKPDPLKKYVNRLVERGKRSVSQGIMESGL